jgi:hypothetical protein
MNYKLKVTPEESKECQKHLFKLEIPWRDGTRNVILTDEPHVYIHTKEKCIIAGRSNDFFMSHSNIEITPAQLLHMSLEDLKNGNIPEVKTMKHYRVKTEEEFIKEFGENWFIKQCFSDHYKDIQEMREDTNFNGKNVFGYVLTDEEIEAVEKGDDVHVEDIYLLRCDLVEIEKCSKPEKPEFKVGDEVYIKATIRKTYSNGDISVNYIDSDNDQCEGFFKQNQLCKEIPETQSKEIKALNNVVKAAHEIVKELNEKADQETIENFRTHLSRKRTSSVMMGTIDLSEEIGDQMILNGKDNRREVE